MSTISLKSLLDVSRDVSSENPHCARMSGGLAKNVIKNRWESNLFFLEQFFWIARLEVKMMIALQRCNDFPDSADTPLIVRVSVADTLLTLKDEGNRQLTGNVEMKGF